MQIPAPHTGEVDLAAWFTYQLSPELRCDHCSPGNMGRPQKPGCSYQEEAEPAGQAGPATGLPLSTPEGAEGPESSLL